MKKITKDSLGGRLRMLRKEKKLTQSSLAEKIGVDSAYISQLETGARPQPREWVIDRICNFFSIDEIWLVAGGDDRRTKVRNKQAQFKLHGGWKPLSLEKLTGVPKEMGMGKAVEMLVDIYNSEDKEAIHNIYNVLKMFTKGIRQTDDKNKKDD